MISVVIATYNGEKYISDQLESIAAQTVLPDEIVVVDDCSSDTTLKLIIEFAAQTGIIVSMKTNKSAF